MSCKNSDKAGVCRYNFSKFEVLPDYIDEDNNCLCEFDDNVRCPYYEDKWAEIFESDEEKWNRIFGETKK